MMANNKNKFSEDLAKEILSVQPMGPEVYKAWYEFYKNSKSREWLRANGYEPVEKNGSMSLMWIKKSDE